MAEGGEGEEEIQFLRTVSPAHFPRTCAGCRTGFNVNLVFSCFGGTVIAACDSFPQLTVFQHQL